MSENTKATYLVTEDDIMKISTLFGQLEGALKELIRNRQLAAISHRQDEAEFYFYELTSRALYECDDEVAVKQLNLDVF